MPKISLDIKDIRVKLTRDYETIFSCYHEAGHTVYALLHFVKVDNVYITESDGRVGGYTHFYSIDLSTIKDKKTLNKLIPIEIGINYAGLAADKHTYELLCGSSTFPLLLQGASTDLKNASFLIRKYDFVPINLRNKFKKKMLLKVKNQLVHHWSVVTIVAHLLYKKKKISYEDLKKEILKKVHNKMFWENQFIMIEKIYTKIADQSITEQELDILY